LLRLYVLSHIPSSSPSQANRPTNSSQGWYTVGQLPRHTIYAPRNTPQNAKLPVLLWGNGACSADGLSAVNFLSQIASHGVLVISQGTPWGQGSTSGQQMRDALNFITSPQARNVNADFAKVDSSRILAAGFSCGGIEAYEQIWDDRVFGVGIWNSGLLNNYEQARNFRKPVFFFLGGPSDIAYQNGERDYNYMQPGVPKWKGNLNVGHGGTYGDYNGGKFGTAASYWVEWLLRGNQTAKSFFTQGGAQRDGWQVVFADLDRIQVNPI
jgi:predicted esterase